MTLNHMICPHCGHDFYTDTAYATCAACQTFFYASASRTCNLSAAPHFCIWVYDSATSLLRCKICSVGRRSVLASQLGNTA
jgi:hypothetical protein